MMVAPPIIAASVRLLDLRQRMSMLLGSQSDLQERALSLPLNILLGSIHAYLFLPTLDSTSK